jgi:hypothetical protein
MASSSKQSSESSFDDRATISHELALQKLNVDLDKCLPASWRHSALVKETIGLMRMTPLGISSRWYTDQSDWFSIAESLHQRESSEMFSLLSSLVRNIFQEEHELTTELFKKSDSLPDVLAAFQPISAIKSSKRIPDGRIRRAHMLSSLVDRLLWASRPSDTGTPLPVQLPHQRFPDDDNFHGYVHLMQSWHRVVRDSWQSLEFKQVEATSLDAPNIAVSLFQSVTSSSHGRKFNTVLENFARCGLGLRAIGCVSFFIQTSTILFL